MGKKLHELGMTTVDFRNIAGLCHWQHKVTKEAADYYHGRDREWFDTHERVCDSEVLKKLLDQHDDIVVTGSISGNMDNLLPLFDKVVLLQCSPEKIIQRLETRDGTTFGKNEVEKGYVLDWQKWFDSRLISQGAIPVSTEGSIETVVDAIHTKVFNIF